MRQRKTVKKACSELAAGLELHQVSVFTIETNPRPDAPALVSIMRTLAHGTWLKCGKWGCAPSSLYVKTEKPRPGCGDHPLDYDRAWAGLPANPP